MEMGLITIVIKKVLKTIQMIKNLKLNVVIFMTMMVMD